MNEYNGIGCEECGEWNMTVWTPNDKPVEYAQVKHGMKLEELEVEAKKLGYRLVKIKPYVTLLPCTCGCKRRWRWYSPTTVIIECQKCGKSAYGRNEQEARINWNKKIQGEEEE